MYETYLKNKNQILNCLEIIWNYMFLNQSIEKSDLIIGCGCANLEIPVKCAQLYMDGYAPKILFAGGYGKITKNSFNKSEAEKYRDIAIKYGVPESDIILETKSTNTGDNFRFAMKVLENENIKHDKIIIVHKRINERRTFSSAKKILNDKELFITSPDITYNQFIENLENNIDNIEKNISVIVGDIQRILIYPQLGWQTKNEIPDQVMKAYEYLRDIGFNKYVFSNEEINRLISNNK